MSFLDALQTQELTPHGLTTTTAVVATPAADETVGPRWLRRYAPLFAVASVLLLALSSACSSGTG